MTAADKLLRGQTGCRCEWCEDRLDLISQDPGLIVDVQNVSDFLFEPNATPEQLAGIQMPGSICPWSQALLTYETPNGMQIVCVCRQPKETFDDFRWIGYVYVSMANLSEVYGIGGFVMRSDINGQHFSYRNHSHPRTEKEEFTQEDEDTELMMGGFLTGAGLVSRMTFSFANSRSVVLERKSVSRQVRRFAERHKEPIFEHHILLIDKMKGVLQSEGGLRENGIEKAWHICRGHLRAYGPDYGHGHLFGDPKRDGVYWIPQHERGSVKAGVITKDYVLGKLS